MQSLIRDHGVVFMGRIPLIAVLLDKAQQVSNPFRHTSITATLQHGGVQVQTVDHEISVSQSAKMYSQFNFQVAIARTNAGKPQKTVSSAVALLRKVSAEHSIRTIESERFHFRS